MVNLRNHEMNQEKYYFDRFDDIETISYKWDGGLVFMTGPGFNSMLCSRRPSDPKSKSQGKLFCF